jgi:hypothetical protein
VCIFIHIAYELLQLTCEPIPLEDPVKVFVFDPVEGLHEVYREYTQPFPPFLRERDGVLTVARAS